MVCSPCRRCRHVDTDCWWPLSTPPRHDAGYLLDERVGEFPDRSAHPQGMELAGEHRPVIHGRSTLCENQVNYNMKSSMLTLTLTLLNCKRSEEYPVSGGKCVCSLNSLLFWKQVGRYIGLKLDNLGLNLYGCHLGITGTVPYHCLRDINCIPTTRTERFKRCFIDYAVEQFI